MISILLALLFWYNYSIKYIKKVDFVLSMLLKSFRIFKNSLRSYMQSIQYFGKYNLTFNRQNLKWCAHGSPFILRKPCTLMIARFILEKGLWYFWNNPQRCMDIDSCIRCLWLSSVWVCMSAGVCLCVCVKKFI